MEVQKNIYKGGRTLLDRFLVFIGKLFLKLRYRIIVKGMEEIYKKGKEKIIFLPNHMALVDPIIISCVLHKYFAPRTIADANNIAHPLLNWVSRRLGARPIPDMTISGPSAKNELRKVMEETIEGMKKGENLLLYPAGRIKRQRREIIGAASATDEIIKGVPGIRVVLIRQNGLWGSSFSWGIGRKPVFFEALGKGLKCLLMNLIFFMPRRVLEIEAVEPKDFPFEADRLTINSYLENFYNAKNDPNTYVPYLLWEKEKTHVVPAFRTRSPSLTI